MFLLILGLVIFIGIHLLPSFVSLRQNLISRLGAHPYKILFALISLGAFIVIVKGMARAPFQPLWTPPPWSSYAALALMPFSFILLAASKMPSNVKRYTPHPMLWGVTLWSVAHLLANGDLASLILFGSFGVYSVFDIWSANLRGALRQEIIQPLAKDAMTIAVGLVVYSAFLWLHPSLFGVAVV